MYRVCRTELRKVIPDDLQSLDLMLPWLIVTFGEDGEHARLVKNFEDNQFQA